MNLDTVTFLCVPFKYLPVLLQHNSFYHLVNLTALLRLFLQILFLFSSLEFRQEGVIVYSISSLDPLRWPLT